MKLRRVLWVMVASFAWTSACGSSDDDDSGADTVTSSNTGFGGASSVNGTSNTSTTTSTSGFNNNSGTGTTGNVLMHDDTECQDEDPVDGGNCDTNDLVCQGEDGSLCACNQGEWLCLEFGSNIGEGGQGGGGGEGGAG